MPLPSKSVLVTGGAGYIGSHVCKALFLAGFLPIAYDNLCQGYRWAVKWGPLLQHDLAEEVELERAFVKYEPCAVIHLASCINVREAQSNPEKYYRNNVCATLSLLNAMCRHNLKCLVFSSSASVYGTPSYLPLDEEHPKAPINVYGRTKWMVEEILNDYAKAYGLCSISLRYFNAAGADSEGDLGEAHQPETHLIPLVIETVLKKRKNLEIYGTDHPTPDGTAIRDFIHVSDLASAHIKALEHLLNCKMPGHTALNLGTGKGSSIREILSSAEILFGSSLPLKICPRFPSDPPSLIADPSKAMHLLGWAPQSSDLQNILSTAWNWHSQVRIAPL